MANAADFDRIAQEVRDNDLDTFTFAEATAWGKELRNTHQGIVIAELKRRGLKMTERLVPREVRGVNSNPNTRWTACPSHGGGGGTSIEGIAGNPG